MEKKKNKILLKAGGMVLAMTIICGVIYTAAVTGIGKLLFGDKANGSIIEVNGVKYGSELLAQDFSDEKHMWGRIMNLNTSTFQDDDGNYLLYSGPSNLSPESDAFKEIVDARVARLKEADPDMAQKQIPEDLVTCSGSGLDPSISAAAAEYQVHRIARNNDMTEGEVEEMIKACTDEKVFGIFGEETVNVLKVNLMLEGILEIK
ncbi:MAG: potassium-transporting ATPase subunit C [Lachnospiraceae bacterium]|nr:potassium-transporting ATPase subunit C [Lachnospiraceae bacterium]